MTPEGDANLAAAAREERREKLRHEIRESKRGFIRASYKIERLEKELYEARVARVSELHAEIARCLEAGPEQDDIGKAFNALHAYLDRHPGLDSAQRVAVVEHALLVALWSAEDRAPAVFPEIIADLCGDFGDDLDRLDPDPPA